MPVFMGLLLIHFFCFDFQTYLKPVKTLLKIVAKVRLIFVTRNENRKKNFCLSTGCLRPSVKVV